MKLRIKSQDDGMVLLELSGEVAQKQLAAMGDPFPGLLGSECYKEIVLLDLHGVETIDSSGIGWLLASHKKFRNQGGLLIIHSLSPFARDVMRILNMQLVFNMAENESSARQTVSIRSTA